jgi:hypothetical protein
MHSLFWINVMPQYSLPQQTAQAILSAVHDVLQGSGFGSVEIVLHEGNVTLIEKREKLRLVQHKHRFEENKSEGADSANRISIK